MTNFYRMDISYLRYMYMYSSWKFFNNHVDIARSVKALVSDHLGNSKKWS